jgi:hypothetical protein
MSTTTATDPTATATATATGGVGTRPAPGATHVGRATVARIAGVTAAAAVGVNAAVYAAARASGAPFRVVEHGRAQTVSPGAIAGMSLAGLAVGFAALAALLVVGSRRRVDVRVLAALGGLVALVSLVPLPAVDATVGTRVALAAMHLAVAAAYAVAVTAVHARRRVTGRV